MKKYHVVFAILASILICMPVNARNRVYKAFGTSRIDVATKVFVGNFWAENWNMTSYKSAFSISNNSFVMTLYPSNDEVWNNYCKVTLIDFSVPDKKTIKKTKKAKENFFYKCKVEFYYNVQFPSIEECFANYGGFIVNSKNADAKKRVVEGAVWLNSDFFTAGKDFDDEHNMIFNLFFDEVAFSIYLYDHLLF